MPALSAAYHQPDTTYLDQSVIDSLSGIMSACAVRALLIDMQRDVILRLERVAEVNIATGSLPLIAQDAHDLKSMGGNFGLTEMADRAGVVERAARSGCVETVRASVPTLLSVGRHSLEALSKCHEFNTRRAT